MHRAAIAAYIILGVFLTLAGIAYMTRTADSQPAVVSAQEKPKAMTPAQIRAADAQAEILRTTDGYGQTNPQAANRQATGQPPANAARFQACRAELKKARAAGALYDLKWESTLPRIVVGPTFFRAPIDTKEGFAKALNCFLVAGATDKCLNFEMLDWQTGKPVGRFHDCRFEML